MIDMFIVFLFLLCWFICIFSPEGVTMTLLLGTAQFAVTVLQGSYSAQFQSPTGLLNP